MSPPQYRKGDYGKSCGNCQHFMPENGGQCLLYSVTVSSNHVCDLWVRGDPTQNLISGGKSTMMTLSEWKNKTGGLADGMDVESIAKKHGVSVRTIEKQLEIGGKVELEHTDSPSIARKIAMDHLVELPDYYTRLKKIEESHHSSVKQMGIIHDIHKNPTTGEIREILMESKQYRMAYLGGIVYHGDLYAFSDELLHSSAMRQLDSIPESSAIKIRMRANQSNGKLVEIYMSEGYGIEKAEAKARLLIKCGSLQRLITDSGVDVNHGTISKTIGRLYNDGRFIEIPPDGFVIEEGKINTNLTKGDIERFTKNIRDKYEPDQFYIYLNPHTPNDIVLSMFVIPKKDRKLGIGSAIMRELTRFADKHGCRILLRTAMRDPHHGTTSSDRLKKFYKRFGFVENSGRNKDYRISENMYRNPLLTKREIVSFKNHAENIAIQDLHT